MSSDSYGAGFVPNCYVCPVYPQPASSSNAVYPYYSQPQREHCRSSPPPTSFECCNGTAAYSHPQAGGCMIGYSTFPAAGPIISPGFNNRQQQNNVTTVNNIPPPLYCLLATPSSYHQQIPPVYYTNTPAVYTSSNSTSSSVSDVNSVGANTGATTETSIPTDGAASDK